MNGTRFCRICLSKNLSRKRQRASVHVCAQCDKTTVDRIEVVIRPLLLSAVVHPPSAVDDTLFGQTCNVVKRRRPDFLWLGKDRCVIAEVDENGGHGTHNYTPNCDFGWIMDMVVALNKLYSDGDWNHQRVPYVHVFRFNPDEYDCGKVSLESRLDFLSDRINKVLHMKIDPVMALVPSVEYMYYHSKCASHINFAKQHPDSIKVITGDLQVQGIGDDASKPST